MSLAVAIWTSPTDYTIAADSLLTVGGEMAQYACKVFTRGPYLLAWSGALPSAQPLVRAIIASEAATIEAAVTGAWAEVAPKCGPPDPWLSTGAWILIVGPEGIAKLDSHGCVVWTPPPAVGQCSYAAIGCAQDYAIGYLDAVEPTVNDRGFERAVIEHAIRRFPAVGGDVVVLSAPVVERVAA